MAEQTAVDRLNEQRHRFRAFLVSRLGSEADADDVLQTGLIKALQGSAGLKDDEKLTAWFYQVLRHAVVDHVRSRRATAAREHAWATEMPGTADVEAHRMLCGCLAAMLPDLKPRESQLVRRVDLEGESLAAAASDLGLSANHAGVVLHRARRHLRTRLTRFCGECASGACLDCDCPPAAGSATPAAARSRVG